MSLLPMNLRLALLPIALLLAAPAAFAEDAAGKWTGGLLREEGRVPVTVAIAKAADGSLSGSADAPSGTVPLGKVASDGDQLSFDLPGMAHCKLKWDEASKMWKGSLTQNGLDFPLELWRAS